MFLLSFLRRAHSDIYMSGLNLALLFRQHNKLNVLTVRWHSPRSEKSKDHGHCFKSLWPCNDYIKWNGHHFSLHRAKWGECGHNYFQMCVIVRLMQVQSKKQEAGECGQGAWRDSSERTEQPLCQKPRSASCKNMISFLFAENYVSRCIYSVHVCRHEGMSAVRNCVPLCMSRTRWLQLKTETRNEVISQCHWRKSRF